MGSTKAQEMGAKRVRTSKKVSDHLANERTFLAWIRTALATIGLGFVIERFGLFLRELGFKASTTSLFSIHFSSLVGVSLTILGVLAMVVALINFLSVHRTIDMEQFYPSTTFPIVLTILATLIGVVLAIYLLLTA